MDLMEEIPGLAPNPCPTYEFVTIGLFETRVVILVAILVSALSRRPNVVIAGASLPHRRGNRE
jgi:hypothetical protein